MMPKNKAKRLAKEESKRADHEARKARGVEIPPGPSCQYKEHKRAAWTEYYWHWIPDIRVVKGQRKDFKGNIREKEFSVQVGVKYVPITNKKGDKVERPVPVYKDGTPKFTKPTLTEVPDVQE